MFLKHFNFLGLGLFEGGKILRLCGAFKGNQRKLEKLQELFFMIQSGYVAYINYNTNFIICTAWQHSYT